MDKNNLIQKFSTSIEKDILYAHILDLMVKSQNKNIVMSSNFISESDSICISKMLDYCACKNYMIYGGYNNSLRNCVVFLPDYLSVEDVVAMPSISDITYIEISVNPYDSIRAELSHRDILGSLMSLGIERDHIGDIISHDTKAVIVIKSSVSEHIITNLKSVSRYSVQTAQYDNYNIVPNIEYDVCSDTVASMRIDAVASAIFNISRSESSNSVLHGAVTLNGKVTTKSDAPVSAGDTLTMRGKGKVIIDDISGVSKKGRIRFTYKRYK